MSEDSVGGAPQMPKFVYPPTTHHRLAEGLPVAIHPESGHYV